MSNNCKSPEMCLLTETCVPCAICPNAKEKADDRLARMACSRSFEPPKIMEYTGNLYGKIGREMIPLKLTSEDVDRMQIAIQDRERQIDELNETIDRIKDQDIAVYAAARAVVDRWDTPPWKDVPATAGFISRLRAALSSENSSVEQPAPTTKR